MQTSKFLLVIDGLNNRLAQAQDSSGSKTVEGQVLVEEEVSFLPCVLTDKG